MKLPGEPPHEGTATGHCQASRRTREPPKTIARQTAARGNRAHPCRRGTRSLRQISDFFRPAQSVRFLTLGGIRSAFLAPSVRFLTLGGIESMHFRADGPKYHGCPPSHSLISQLVFPSPLRQISEISYFFSARVSAVPSRSCFLAIVYGGSLVRRLAWR